MATVSRLPSTIHQHQSLYYNRKRNSISLRRATTLRVRAAKLPAGVEMPKVEPKLTEPFLGFTKTAEIWNSRAGMIGIIGTFIVELPNAVVVFELRLASPRPYKSSSRGHGHGALRSGAAPLRPDRRRRLSLRPPSPPPPAQTRGPKPYPSPTVNARNHETLISFSSVPSSVSAQAGDSKPDPSPPSLETRRAKPRNRKTLISAAAAATAAAPRLLPQPRLASSPPPPPEAEAEAEEEEVEKLNKLSGLKRYKISEILFFDGAAAPSSRAPRTPSSRWSPSARTVFHEGAAPEGARNPGLLRNVREGRPRRQDEAGRDPRPDRLLHGEHVAVGRRLPVHQRGLMQQTKQMDLDPDMTDREKLEYFRSQERDYRRRIERSRPCLLPVPVQREVMQMLRSRGRSWKGYHTQLVIQFQDKLGNVVEGNTQLPVIRGSFPSRSCLVQLRPGHVFNIEAGKQALRNINSLALFSNIEVNPRPDEKSEGGIIVEIKLKELEQKSAEVSTEWSIGSWTSILVSVTSSNLLNPQDDLSFKLDYCIHIWMVSTTLATAPSVLAALTAGSEPVFTGRAWWTNFRLCGLIELGLKPILPRILLIIFDRCTNILCPLVHFQSFTRQSKFTYGLVMEEIITRDETSSICTHGSRALPSGGLSMDGPPTTLSGTGTDRMAFAQAILLLVQYKFVKWNSCW
uniref:Uncharacterized protein n=1 Tax=Ananas comosus var. bracteatus TaxID=296719 RepID=A0A6V7NLL8_ANACO|nr:unnamed protein product [Ananas comosus var. bracteatus]